MTRTIQYQDKEKKIPMPKGYLFYGPPRTGKTHSCRQILDYLDFVRIIPDTVAGDFSKPLVGLAEKTIQEIG